MLDLDKLTELYDATTRGPWHVRRGPPGDAFVEAPRAKPSDPYDIEILGDDENLYPTRDEDVEWIAAMHTAFPELVVALREFRSRNA